MTVKNNKIDLPFKVIVSEVSGGFIDSIHNDFTGGINIVNYHEEKYGNFEQNPLQSPFTNQWVGGYPFRHVEINTGSDNSQNRQEAWHLDFNTSGVRFYSHKYKNSPPSYWSRDMLAKSPINIKNIKTKTSSLNIGNFSNNYEVVQTSGRRITNNLVVDGFIAGGELQTQFVRFTPITPAVLESYSYQEDFSSYTLEQPVDNSDIQSFDLDVVKIGSDIEVAGQKFIVFNNEGEIDPILDPLRKGRYINFKTLLTGSTTLEMTVVNNDYPVTQVAVDYLAYTYTGDFLELGITETGDDLVLEYSLDGETWSTHSVLVYGGVGDGVQVNSISLTINTILEPYYLRISQVFEDPTGGFPYYTRNYAVTDIDITGTKVANPELPATNDIFPYSLPVLNSITGSKSIIVERFNAPGSKEESSRGALDREGEEMSPNIPLPFRNIRIRQPFYKQLREATPQFGGSIHGVNRNTLTRAGNELVDNGYVVRSLPSTDIQYKWIGESTAMTPGELGGYQSFSETDDGSAYTDILFNTGSLVTSGSNQQYLVDNFGIRSLLRNTKIVNLGTNTISNEASISASFSEYTNSPYGFGSWTSIRNGENVLINKQKKQSIFTIQQPAVAKNISLKNTKTISIKPKRSHTIRAFTEPNVTFKYKPLQHKLSLQNSNTNLGYNFSHTYTNNLSTFSNKQLVDFLSMDEDREQFYDILYSFYTDDLQEIDNNPIRDYLGHSYTEIVWPKEENTGLKRTRRRELYTLDQSGFDRDGYDRQLGTQRAFWRASQDNRRRTGLSDGGYYNSMNYLSVNESGSSFLQQETGLLSSNKFIDFNSSLEVATTIDKGIFNSISLLEPKTSENLILNFSASVYSTFINPQGTIIERVHNKLNNRTFSFETSGEFNNMFNDFYEQLYISGETEKKSVGTLYRNTSYKSLLTVLPEELAEYKDFAIRTFEESVFVNPKLKYISFPGGGELNSGSFVNSEVNFSGSYQTEKQNFQGIIWDMKEYSGELYFSGDFDHINNQLFKGLAKYSSGEILNLGNELLASPERSSDSAIKRIVFDGADIYATSYPVLYWDGLSWATLPQSDIQGLNAAVFYDGELYLGGNFVKNDNADWSATNIVKWDGSVWTEVSGGLGPNGQVRDLLIDGTDLYAVGSFAGGAVVKIAVLDTTNPAGAWVQVGNLNGSANTIVSHGGAIYIGGLFYDNVAPNDHGSFITKWDGVSLSAVGSNIQHEVTKLLSSGGELYAFTNPGSADVNSIFKFNGTDWDEIEGSNFDGEIRSAIFYDGNLYVGGNFTKRENNLAVWDGEKWFTIESNREFDNFSEEYFQQTFLEEEFAFSTMDMGLQRTTEQDSDNQPYYDSYESFVDDIVPLAKDYSIIPEFNSSKNMDFYLLENNRNFRKSNKKMFSIDGTEEYESSVNGQQYNQTFVKKYLTSDLLKKEEEIYEDNKGIAELDKINLKVSGIKKLLPYNGFYPQDRTVQIANLYNDYLDNSIAGGTYNLSYRNDFTASNILPDVLTPDGYNGGSATSISVERFNNLYYMAVGEPDTAPDSSSPGETGRVMIFTSSLNEPLQWSPGYKEITGSFSSLTSTEALTASFGRKVQLVSASNGLNLFILSALKDVNETPPEGYILHCTSSNGTLWSEPLPIYVSGTIDNITGSFTYFDITYNIEDEKEKIVLATDSLNNTSTDGGLVFVVTGALESEGWEWTEKKLIHSGSVGDRAGQGISVLSCSSGYQIFFAARKSDNPSSNNGNIYVSTSPDSITWSNATTIASGEITPNLLGALLLPEIGLNDVKSANFNGKTYVFFSEPYHSLGGFERNGAVFCVTSSANNTWPSVDSTLDKKLIYYRPASDDTALAVLDTADQGTGSYSIQTFIGSDERLYYMFANQANDDNRDRPEVVIGYTDKDDFWQTTDDENIFKYTFPKNLRGSATTIAASSYNIGDYSLPIVFVDIDNDVYAIKNTVFTEFSLKRDQDGKYYKQAALEPFMAPGILYNTIKSGIAVDWPCATGSNTAIVPYSNNSVVNAYYPQPFEMSGYDSENGRKSMYGLLRSNIDYRIPFENLIFPNEAFRPKTTLEKDLISRTVLTTLEEGDPLAEFLDGTYVYGGYEPYISPVDFSDIDNLGPKRFSVPFVYRKEGFEDSGRYTLAMSNFLAETVKFFLKDEKMTTFVSDPDYKWKQFNADVTYYMDIILEKTPDLVMMEAYHSDLHPTGSNGEKMNGRYFGYPINKTSKQLWAGADFTEEEKKLIHNDPAYAPYTPPYFEGVARARISFNPTGPSRVYSLQEIFDEAVVENIFIDLAKGATEDSDAFINKMKIASSIEVFGSTQAVEVTIDEITGKQTVREDQDSQQWVVSPKMETPVLDFSSQDVVKYQNDYSKTGGFGRGMWSGFGTSPTNGKGVKMRLEYPFTNIQSPLTASLMEQIGFKAEERNIGQLADKKLISEAVVLIPYLETQNEDYSVENDSGFNFIRISRDTFNAQREKLRQNADIVSEERTSTSISKMIEKMQNYVIPPEMNFVEYEDIEPFVMYIFEFEELLDREDLTNIWQGVMPGISKDAKMQDVEISHPSDKHEFFEGKQLPEDLRWLVFKIKRKGEYNYFNVTTTTTDDARFDFNKIIGRKEGTDIYSYNWPYDFFSLVEFAKVELKLDYKKKEEESN